MMPETRFRSCISLLALRRAMMTLVPQFTTDRMVKEYTRKYYTSLSM